MSDPGPDHAEPRPDDPDQAEQRPHPDQPEPRPDQVAPRPSARDLVRRRSRSYRSPETGRHHHIGAAPERQPVLADDGSSSYVGTSPVQLAERTVAQLQAQRRRLQHDMAAAAADLRFEQAAALRDDLDRVDAELARRSSNDPRS